MSKLPVRETPQRTALSPTTQAILALIQGLLPALTAIIGGVWVAFTYMHQQQEALEAQSAQAVQENRTRLLQAQKDFLDHQLNQYETILDAAARIAADPHNQPDQFIELRRHFDTVFGGPFQMFADTEVMQAVQGFRSKLQSITAHGGDVTKAESAELQQLAREQRNHKGEGPTNVPGETMM